MILSAGNGPRGTRVEAVAGVVAHDHAGGIFLSPPFPRFPPIHRINRFRIREQRARPSPGGMLYRTATVRSDGRKTGSRARLPGVEE